MGFGLVIRFFDRLYTHDSWLNFTHHWHTQCSPSITVSNSRFLGTDFNIGTMTVSLSYTFHISHIKSSLHRRTFNWAILQLTGGHFTPSFLSSIHRVTINWLSHSHSHSHIETDGLSIYLGVEPHIGLTTKLSRVLLTETGFGLVIRFINHLQLQITITYLHNLQSLHYNFLSLIPTCLHYQFPGNGSQYRSYHRLTLQISLDQVSLNYN
jgi:hypothetical protein